MPLLRALLLLLAALLIGTPAAAVTYPKFTGLVVDDANVLPAATRQDLETKLEKLQQDTHRQLVVATIADVQGETIEDYGIGLLRAWGPGLKDVNNGAILFIAPNEPAGHRGPRIEVGYGLEPILTDAFSGVTIRQQMMPKLRPNNDIPGAMEAGTDALIAQLRASPEEAKARTDAAIKDFDRAHQRSGSGGAALPIGLIVFWGFVLLFLVLSWSRRAHGSRYVSNDGGSSWPVILWGIANEIGRDSGRSDWGGGSSWSGGGDSGGGSDGSWGGGGFTGGGGGSGGGGGASGDW